MVKRKGLFACFCRSLSLSTLSCCSFVLLVKRTEVETKLGTKYGLRALYMDVQATSPMVGWLRLVHVLYVQTRPFQVPYLHTITSI